MLPAPLYFPEDSYSTPKEKATFIGTRMPTATFYANFLGVIFKHCLKANRVHYTGNDWAQGSYSTLTALEKSGVKFELDGLENITKTEQPCIFIGNHMSTLETFILPSIIQPRRKVTFVAKKELVELPFFGKLFQSRNPVTVSRSNPKKDYVAVMEGGMERLSKGISIIVFPQSTRTTTFDPALFNTIGIKLAKKANVPIVPVALQTSSWECGKLIKDFGPINNTVVTRFSFGAPLTVEGTGKEEHAHICNFISEKLLTWNSSPTVTS